jgi:hypothetical protein
LVNREYIADQCADNDSLHYRHWPEFNEGLHWVDSAISQLLVAWHSFRALMTAGLRNYATRSGAQSHMNHFF